MLERMGLAYDSTEAVCLARVIAEQINTAALLESYQIHKKKKKKDKGAVRNVTLTCAQPTGSITPLMGNKGYAIEPFFHEATKLSKQAHVEMQAAWQSGVQNGISKTVNLPCEATAEDVREVVLLALEKGCKSVTVYRDKSHAAQPQPLGDCKGC